MSLAKIDRLIDALRHERFRWTPVRRVHIPKKNGKLRPLGLPTWTDKLLQEVMRSILEAYFEPQFSAHSHGFRPGRGCHTALSEVQRGWTGRSGSSRETSKGASTTFDHEVLLRVLGEKIHDNRFLDWSGGSFRPDILEDWRYGATLSGTPQGGVLSPLLANIYLNELDQFVEQELLPAYNRGTRRRRHPHYADTARSARNGCGVGVEWKKLARCTDWCVRFPHKTRATQPTAACTTSATRMTGSSGSPVPRLKPKTIKARLRRFLRDHLKLELSEEKTLITHAGDEAARFLGYEICSMHADDKLDQRGRRSVNGHVMLKVPWDVIMAMCSRYERRGKPEPAPTCWTTMISASLVGTARNSGATSTTTPWPTTSGSCPGSSGPWRPRCSRPLPTSTRARVTAMARNTGRGHHTRRCAHVLPGIVERGRGSIPGSTVRGLRDRRRKDAILVDQRPPSVHERPGVAQTAPGRRVRVVRQHLNVEVHHSASWPTSIAPGAKRFPSWLRLMAARKTENAGRVPRLSRGHPCRTAHATAPLGMNHWRAACGESLQARFGGGPTEKCPCTRGNSPAAYPTLRQPGGELPPADSPLHFGAISRTGAPTRKSSNGRRCAWRPLGGRPGG